MKAIQRISLGKSRSALELIDVPDITAASPGCVVIEMQYSPIDHCDLRPSRAVIDSLEAQTIAGTEGVGKVIMVGDVSDEMLLGRMVIAPASGIWVERVAVPSHQLLALPDVDPLQLSMLRVNPSAAWLLLSEFVPLNAGDWIIQNAANSGVGRAIIGFASTRGIRTISLVRRAEVIEEIDELAGDFVFLDRDEGIIRAVESAQGAPIRLAMDAVGGGATARLARALSPGGTLVSYAYMAKREAPADLRPLLSKGLHLSSFCLADSRYETKLPSLIAASAKLLADKKLHIPVAAVYPASEFARAAAHAIEGGKILLDLRPGRWV